MRIKQVKSVFAFAVLAILLITMFSPDFVFATDGVFNDFNVSIESDTSLGGTKDGEGAQGWKQIIVKYKSFIVGIAGVAAVTMVALFIFQFIKLGQSAGNPQARSQALTGVLWTGVAAAGLGSVALITSLFYNSIKSTTAPTP